MSWTAFVNQAHITKGQAFYNMFVAFQAAGWTCLGSGDGTGGHYSATDGTALTNGNGALVAATFSVWNTGAWFRIQQPKSTGPNGQRREYVVQQGGAANSSLTARVKYSPNVTGSSGGFTGGSPSASQVPSAADEEVVYGSGTDAAPTYSNWIGQTNYQFQQHMVFDTDGDDGYAFVCWTVTQGGQTCSNGYVFAMDIMRQGTGPDNDTDPCIVIVLSSGFGSSLWGTQTCWGFVGGISSAQFVKFNLQTYAAGTDFVPGPLGGADAWTGKGMAVIPCWVQNQATSVTVQPGGTCKGYSTLFLLGGSYNGFGMPLQTVPNSGGDYINLLANTGNLTWVRWPPNTPYSAG